MADTKVVDMTAVTVPTVDDLLYLVDDPSGAIADRKLALSDLLNTLIGFIIPQGRLTLTSGTPFLSSSVTAATTIYYSPAVGAYCPIYNGTIFIPTLFTELSQATTDSTKSPAACITNSNYDLFVWNDSGTIRCTRGPAWTSDTARGTGAGTSELEFVKGILLNKNAITNGPGADRGTYVGTIRTNGSSQVDMIFGGSGAAGGESTILGIWNMYNRRFVSLINFDNTDTWNYTTASFRIKNNNNNNKIQFVIGWQGDGAAVKNNVGALNSSANIGMMCGIGLNSTTAKAAASSVGRLFSSITNAYYGFGTTYSFMLPLGFGYVAPLEYSTASGTTTWCGDNGGADVGGAAIYMDTMY